MSESTPPSPEPRSPATSRRRFFGELLRQTLSPFADEIDARLDAVRDATRLLVQRSAGRADAYGGPPALPVGDEIYPARAVLRPPGAIDEDAFVTTCSRCQACVQACPANAIQPLHSSSARMHLTPMVEPAVQACVLCDTLACMPACPSGALVVTTREHIRMGLAVWDRATCTRTRDYDQDDCQLCVTSCPVGPTAIEISPAGVSVHRDGCVGCGRCEQVCPTRPKSVRIVPL